MILHCFPGFSRGREYVTGMLSILISDLVYVSVAGRLLWGRDKITGVLV